MKTITEYQLLYLASEELKKRIVDEEASESISRRARGRLQMYNEQLSEIIERMNEIKNLNEEVLEDTALEDKTDNVSVFDNGACFMVTVNGTWVEGFRSLGDAWRHIAWMYRVATQKFTVGKNEVPVEQWLEGMIRAGYLEENDGFKNPKNA